MGGYTRPQDLSIIPSTHIDRSRGMTVGHWRANHLHSGSMDNAPGRGGPGYPLGLAPRVAAHPDRLPRAAASTHLGLNGSLVPEECLPHTAAKLPAAHSDIINEVSRGAAIDPS